MFLELQLRRLSAGSNSAWAVALQIMICDTDIGTQHSGGVRKFYTRDPRERLDHARELYHVASG